MSLTWKIPLVFPNDSEKQMAYEVGFRAGQGYLRAAIQFVIRREAPNPRGRPAKRRPRPTTREGRDG